MFNVGDRVRIHPKHGQATCEDYGEGQVVEVGVVEVGDNFGYQVLKVIFNDYISHGYPKPHVANLYPSDLELAVQKDLVILEDPKYKDLFE